MKFFQDFIILLLLLVRAAVGQHDLVLSSYLRHFCHEGDFTPYKDYGINLNYFLFRQLENQASNLFYNGSRGTYPDEVHGLFSCRGDISNADCQSCVFDAAQEVLIRRCPRRKTAMIWFEGCFVRYANTSFISKLDVEPHYYIWDSRNVSEPWTAFNLAVTDMFWNLTELATSDKRNFAAGEVSVTGSLKLYGLVQCRLDISGSDCKKCLEIPISSMHSSVRGSEGGRYVNPSCNLRYAIYSFTSPAQRTSDPPYDSSSNIGSKGRETLRILVGVSVSVALLLLLSVVTYFLHSRRRRERIHGDMRNIRQESELGIGQPQKSFDLALMDFNLISAATNHFSHQNKLGEGGFGPVYKGTLPDGQDIAVKRHLSGNSKQGFEQYQNEVTLIAKLQHRNLVKLLGCCLEGNELLLIYEYLPNKSLDRVLFDHDGSIELNWRTRFSIINGIARGILYLHEDSRLRIIHRDLKASNILLDHEMNPKISDFGMARIFYSNNTANTNRIAGTFGYMAPEYAMEGLFSVKSDVYSFGVILLEIISGRRNSRFDLHDETLLGYAWKLWSESENRSLELVDPSLNQSDAPSEILRCIHIALLCVQDDPDNRPTMSSVVYMLSGEGGVTLQKPSQPSFTVQRTAKNTSISINDLTVSSISPR